MIALDALSSEIKDRLATLGTAELVIAIPGVVTENGLRDAAGRVRRAVDGLAPGPKTVLVHPDGAVFHNPSTPEAEGPALLPFPISPLDRFPEPGQNVGDAY